MAAQQDLKLRPLHYGRQNKVRVVERTSLKVKELLDWLAEGKKSRRT